VIGCCAARVPRLSPNRINRFAIAAPAILSISSDGLLTDDDGGRRGAQR
jgi:hypothetical protein